MKATSLEIIIIPIVGMIRPIVFREVMERIEVSLKKMKKRGKFEMDFIEVGHFFRDEYKVRWSLKKKII